MHSLKPKSMATKKPTAKQLAARAKFTAAVKAGKFRKKKKAAPKKKRAVKKKVTRKKK